MNNLRGLMKSLSLGSDQKMMAIVSRNVWNTTHLDRPNMKQDKKGVVKNYRRVLFYPKDHNGNPAYTVEPLKYRNLGGRDIISGRVVVAGLGGGIKEDIHWVHDFRRGPTDDSPPLEERVIQIIPSPAPTVRTANLALVGSGDFLKLILATENMKAGDILKTSMFIPRIPESYQQYHAQGPTNNTMTRVLPSIPSSKSYQQYHDQCPTNNTKSKVLPTIPSPKSYQQYQVQRPTNNSMTGVLPTIPSPKSYQQYQVQSPTNNTMTRVLPTIPSPKSYQQYHDQRPTNNTMSRALSTIP
ncbi:hypothetical protein M8J76_015750 [Diaphorina citri]|nr:hypothetical protein M8J75_007568 [Diaphorina citri]KAI5716993.1 hypothetical protein M8J76_015750 [Diaphorina citri]